MESSPRFYAQFVGLFAVVALMVGFNFAVWGLHRETPSPVLPIATANAEHGRRLLQSYGCGACHVIPGVPGAVGEVGPGLDRFVRQMYVAGTVPNHPTNLVRWIVDPQSVSPGTAMPNLGVGEDEAREMSAYLYQLR